MTSSPLHRFGRIPISPFPFLFCFRDILLMNFRRCWETQESPTPTLHSLSVLFVTNVLLGLRLRRRLGSFPQIGEYMVLWDFFFLFCYGSNRTFPQVTQIFTSIFFPPPPPSGSIIRSRRSLSFRSVRRIYVLALNPIVPFLRVNQTSRLP